MGYTVVQFVISSLKFFIDKNDMFFKSQCGFGKNYCTLHPIIDILKLGLEAWNLYSQIARLTLGDIK